MKTNFNIGEVPALDWVDVDLIDVDDTYQRNLDERSVAKIVAGFRWDKFGAVVLSPQPSGRFHVTDGQHRTRAAKLHPDVTHVPATIIHATGVQEEAKNFLALNLDRKAVTAIDKFWAGVAAEDPVCLRVHRVAQAAGCDVARKGGGGIPAGQTAAVGALTRAVTLYGDLATKQALLAIDAAWTKDPSALRGILIISLAKLIEGDRTINTDSLTRVLASKAFADIAAAADGVRKLSGGSAEAAFTRTIGEMYNRANPKKKINFGGSA